MRFLLTNDDGIDSPFLRVLAEAAVAAGHEVAVVAPSGDRSWIAKAISRQQEVTVEELAGWPGAAWSISGTPADAVNLGLGSLVAEPVDAVLAGINIGFNVTLPLILSSGTVGAAIEATGWPVHAFAFSQQLAPEWFAKLKESSQMPPELVASLTASARRAVALVESVAAEHSTEGRIVQNVNFPFETSPETPLRVTQPVDFQLDSVFTEKAKGRYGFAFQSRELPAMEPWHDRRALEEGVISHSILDFSRIRVP